MNDASADKYVDSFFSNIEACNTEDGKKRMLRLLVKEVERDTRHKAATIVNMAVNEIHNMQH